MEAVTNTPLRCPRCGRRHLQLITYTAAELHRLTEEDFQQLDHIRGDVCKQAAWWRAWRKRRDGGAAA